MRWRTADAAPDRPLPQPGDVVFVSRAASVQFDGANGFNFRIIRVDQSGFAGWVWLDGFQLGPLGGEAERREIFVRAAGLCPAREQRARQESAPTTRQPGRRG